MTPDEQYCVPECTGIYAHRNEEDRICSCRYGVASDGKTCLSTCERWTFLVDMEEYCVDECPEDLKPAGSSATKGTCLICAEATTTAESPNGERPFWDPMTEKCVTACEQAGVNGVCRTCAEAYFDKSFFSLMTRECVEECPVGTLRSGSEN